MTKLFLTKNFFADYSKNTVEGSNDASLMIKADKRYYKIQLDDIMFIEGLKDYVVIYTQNQKLITAMNLKTIHQKISSPFSAGE